MRRLAEPLAWWVTLYGLYLGVVSTISVTEMAVGAVGAAAGAAAAVAVRRALLTPDSLAIGSRAADGTDSYRPRLGWLGWLAPLPGQILRDSAHLLRGRVQGGLGEVTLPADPRAAAHRGLAALVISTPPGAFVVDVDPDRDVLVVHRIGRRPSAVERQIGIGS